MDISQYKYKTELHAHTSPCSACSEIPPEEVVKNYAELGYTSVVISNHFNEIMPLYGDKEKSIPAYLDDYKRALNCADKYGINVILGCEIKFNDSFNDYLLFGIEEDLLYDAYDYFDKGIETFSKWFRREGRLLIQAHPFRNAMTQAEPELLDGIEVFNFHPHHNSRCSVAAQYAKKHNMIVTCGTDFHHPGHQGQVALLTKTPLTNSMEVAKVLKSRDYLFMTGDSIILPYGAQKNPEL